MSVGALDKKRKEGNSTFHFIFLPKGDFFREGGVENSFRPTHDLHKASL